MSQRTCNLQVESRKHKQHVQRDNGATAWCGKQQETAGQASTLSRAILGEMPRHARPDTPPPTTVPPPALA